jgi:hypothetical protein
MLRSTAQHSPVTPSSSTGSELVSNHPHAASPLLSAGQVPFSGLRKRQFVQLALFGRFQHSRLLRHFSRRPASEGYM